MNEEKEKIIIEQVAAGLRKCKYTPDFFVWIDNKDFVWGSDKVLTIPILYVGASVSYVPYADSDLLFIPAWRREEENCFHAFERGYSEGVK